MEHQYTPQEPSYRESGSPHMEFEELKAYTDPIWQQFQGIPSAQGEIKEVYGAFLDNGCSREEAHLRTIAYIYRRAVKEGELFWDFDLWSRENRR
jgi:hypothetical protein